MLTLCPANLALFDRLVLEKLLRDCTSEMNTVIGLMCLLGAKSIELCPGPSCVGPVGSAAITMLPAPWSIPQYEVENDPNVPPYELDALYDLYNATNGPQWNWLDTTLHGVEWTFTATSNPCATPRWQGIACTSAVVNGYVNVESIDLHAHNLQGSLPESIGNFSQLKDIDLSENLLIGQIPATMSMLSNMIVLNLDTNQLNGTIPVSLSELTLLEVAYLNTNTFTGTLPELFGTLVHLTELMLYENEFDGTIPSAYCELTSLTVLNVGHNNLVGAIPDNIGALTKLTTLALNSNNLHGAIPQSLDSLLELQYLYLDTNSLDRTIPASVGNFTALLFLSLNDNLFTGRIPHSLATLTALQNLYLHNNRLTGTIPGGFGAMQVLVELDFSHNKLTGRIPPEFGSMANLAVLNLYTNLLTGTLPVELSQLSRLHSVILAQNQLTGSIPAEFGLLAALTCIEIYEAHLTGTVPASIGNMSFMGVLSLYDNHLTGTIPSSVSQMRLLNSFFMSNNLFTGSVAGFINATVQVNLAVVQISGNQLTGQLPDDLFLLPQLQTLAAVSNCFHGTIPTSACDSTTIKTLSLDGLRTGSSCQNVILPGLFGAYLLNRHFTQGVPTCLFEIPSLNTLHLSGNGLTGSLPDNVNISVNLVDVSLSHNQLTGSVPKVFQQRIWLNLDLSYNKFKGTLTQSFATVPGNLTVFDYLGLEVISANPTEYFIPRAALSLRNNRLSHVIPPSVQEVLNVSVLDGNLFDCLLDESDLPAHDDGKAIYQCSSLLFNVPCYIFGAILCILAALVAAEQCWKSSPLAAWFPHTELWKHSAGSVAKPASGAPLMPYHVYFSQVLGDVCWIAAMFALFSAAVLLPAYAILSGFYGTHTYEYAWAVSGTFLCGEAPFAVLFVFYTLLVAAVVCAFYVLIARMRKFVLNVPGWYPAETTDAPKRPADPHRRLRKAMIFCLYAVANVSVVLAANLVYVFAALYADSNTFGIVQILMSVFKLGWNSYYARKLTMFTDEVLASSAANGVRSHDFFTVQLCVMLFNIIAVPCIVVAAISPNCVANMVVASPAVSSHFYYDACSDYSAIFGCLAYAPVVASTTYSPPFTYSYECSSSLITYYSPTFVFMGLFLAFGVPLADIVLYHVHTRAKRGTKWFAFVDYCIPQLLKEVTAESAEADVEYSVYSPIFNASYLLVSIVSYLGVLLTFGIVFPPLAVVMFVSICSMVWVANYKVSRLLSTAEALNINKYSAIIDNECRGVGSTAQLNHCLWALVTVCCVFYTLFLFDTLGDTVGFKGSFWVLIVVPLLPIVAYKCTVLVRYVYATRTVSEGTESAGVEVGSIVHKIDFGLNHKVVQGQHGDAEVVNVVYNDIHHA